MQENFWYSNNSRQEHDPESSTILCLSVYFGATTSEDLEVEMALHNSASLELVFQQAVDGNMDDDGGGNDGEHDDDEVEDKIEDEGHGSKGGTMHWVDRFILNTRHKGGRQTETSVLKLYKLPGALHDRLMLDDIIDANHMIHYLKYAATHHLLTKCRKEKETDDCLSAQSLKKIVTMLGHIHCWQQDSDPNLVHTHPAMNSCCQDFIKSVMVQAQHLQIEYSATLNRGDELVCLPLAFLQPYTICLTDSSYSNSRLVGMSREIFGVLGMFWDTKTATSNKNKPTYNFVTPHRDPLRCLGDLILRVPGWDWGNVSTWRQVCLMFRRTVDKARTGNGISKMYKGFLKETSISSSKKAHLARQIVPTLLEDMGVSANHINAIGHWAVTVLAGFYVRETY
ncbi:hypothetical protein L208DRAFT_1378470 [Tricholoma matsutake]|nr:hypothetical protein L208DRAFT_1378470 [Tricholoma matsutake 945]